MHKILIICLFVIHVYTQNKTPLQFTISSLIADDGLSQVSNYFRFEDSQGFMWITAADALNKYDGFIIKIFYFEDGFSYFKII